MRSRHQRNHVALDGRRIWITGASSGIGAALAEALADYDVQLVISARSEGPLNTLARKIGTERCHVAAADLSSREGNQQCASVITEHLGGIDTIILNAGNCEYVDVSQFNSQAFANMLQTNVMSQVYGIEATLPLLRRSKQGHIVGVSSQAGRLGLPRSEAYGASKAAIHNMLEALRVDLKAEGIDVSAIYPGFVKTPLTDRNDFPMPFLVSPEEAARVMVDGIAQRRAEIHFPRRLSALIALAGRLPAAWYTRLAQSMVRPS
ncbi:MAG TPA: short-chain dehydrogenase [Porticoccaceae bacterium]|nr:short-chain dehydrogenase [Porticoccaceae bacterium]HCO61563.1 short-chain dehydrogenase [Porticoccaceae bacterium]